MKKIFTLFAALTMVMSMFAAQETVYFVNANDWTGTIKAYGWGGTASDTWPGNEMKKENEKIGGKDVYSYTKEAGTYVNIIFNNKEGDNGNQTADLTWTAGKYYVKDGWYTKAEVEEQLGKPDVYIVAGQPALLGSEWSNNDANNTMTKQTDGSYQLVKKDITLAVGTYEYKVVLNYDWNTCYPGENAKLEIATDGTYDVTFKFVPSTSEVSATATAATTAVEDVEATQANVKFIHNGQMVVRYNGKLYNVMGQEVKE